MSIFTWEEIPVPNAYGTVTFGEAFSISPDGRTLLYTTYEALLIHDLMLVEKFSPAQTPVARFRTLIARTLR